MILRVRLLLLLSFVWFGLPAPAATILGKHPADKVLDAFMAQNTNASTIARGLSNSIVPLEAPATGINLGGELRTSWPTGGSGSADTNGLAGTNLLTYITPMMFGADRDPATDDYLAWSNCIAAYNAGRGDVIHGGGFAYRITNALPLVRARGVVEHYTWLFTQTNQCLFDVTNRFDQGVFPISPGHSQAQFTLRYGNMFQVGGEPGPGSIAVRLGGFSTTNNQGYSVNWRMEYCVLTNWWQGVFLNSAVQGELYGNTIHGSWSNAIFAQGGMDMTRIINNDLDNRTYGWVPGRMTNAIAIYIHPWQALKVRIEDNNYGGYKQVLKAHDVGELFISGNQWEGHYTLDTNLTNVELWNTTAFWKGNQVGTQSGSSNYSAQVAMYAFGSGRHGLDKSTFEGLNDNFTFRVFSTNAFDANIWVPETKSKVIVRYHQAFDDAGLTYTYDSKNGTGPVYGQRTNHIYFNKYGDQIWQNGGTEIFRVNYVGASLLVAGASTFTGAVNLPANTASISQVDRGGGTTWDFTSYYRNHWRLKSTTGSEVDISGSNNLLRITSNLSGTAAYLLGISANGWVTTNVFTGTPDGSKFLRDDLVWTAIPGGGDAVLADTQTFTGSNTFSGGFWATVLNLGTLNVSNQNVVNFYTSLTNAAFVVTDSNGKLTAGTLTTLEASLEAIMELQDMQGAVTTGQLPSGATLDTEWDSEAEVQTAWGSVNILLETEIDASSELRALMDDESGTGALLFAGGAIGAATGTSPSVGDSSTLVPTTAWVQGEVDSTRTGSHASPSTSNPLAPTWTGPTHVVWYGATGEIDLPAAAGYGDRGIIIYNTGAFTVTIDPNGSEVIVRDGTVQTGGVTMTLSSGAGNYVALVSDGTRWITLGYKGTLAAGS